MNRKYYNNFIGLEETKESIAYIAEMMLELELDSIKINNQVDLIHQQVLELDKTVQRTNDKVDSNLSLFSPFDSSQKNIEENKLKQESHALLRDLPELKDKLKVHSNKRKQYEQITRCLMQLVEYQSQTEIDDLYADCTLGLKILETQEMERQRIARDLHDSVIQNLTSLVHKTELCIKLLEIDVVRTRLEMATTINTIRNIINDMREIIYNLRPISMNVLSLNETIEQFVLKFKQQNRIRVVLDVDDDQETILPIVKVAIFRIIQEACSNISKYAKATICYIVLHYNEDQIELSIEDNGIGYDSTSFAPSIDTENSGFGLSIMKERVHLLSGDFQIETIIGKGTRIVVSIPCCKHKGE